MKIKDSPELQKLIHERLSLWVKLLKEKPEDVPNSLHQELKMLLIVSGIVTSNDIGDEGN